MRRLRGLLPLPVARAVALAVSGALLYGGAVACGNAGSGALPAVTTTPTRSLSSQPQPSRSAAVTPPAATVTTTATTTARPPLKGSTGPTPTSVQSSAAVVAPSAASTTTPTTAPVATSSDSGSTWGWWVLGIALLAVIGGIIWAVLARRRKWAAWRAEAAPVAQQTHVVTDLIPVPPQRDTDPAHWQQVREQAEHNAQDLEAVAAHAPSDDATRLTQGVARALREEVSAAEAIRLLEAAPTAPTGPQLSQAEEATRHARIDLDASQARLDALVGTQVGTDAGSTTSIN